MTGASQGFRFVRASRGGAGAHGALEGNANCRWTATGRLAHSRKGV